MVSSSYDDGGDDGDIKLECDESGCVMVKTTSKTLEEEDDRGGFLCCDLTGWREFWVPPQLRLWEFWNRGNVGVASSFE